MSLAAALGLGARELVAFVGGGGKTATILALAGELGSEGRRVLLTTTTMIGADQTAGIPVSWSREELAGRWPEGPGVRWLLTGRHAEKATGPDPATIDGLFREEPIHYLLVEADGARGKPFKAPGGGEPVVPKAATLTVVMMGIDAVGLRVAEASHRVERVRALTGLAPDDRLGPADCATVLGHPEGGLRGVPAASRVVVALTKVRPGSRARAAAKIAGFLFGHGRISGIVTIEDRPGRTGA